KRRRRDAPALPARRESGVFDREKRPDSGQRRSDARSAPLHAVETPHSAATECRDGFLYAHDRWFGQQPAKKYFDVFHGHRIIDIRRVAQSVDATEADRELYHEMKEKLDLVEERFIGNDHLLDIIPIPLAVAFK
ncbi:MAG: hypothetical protein ABEI86_10155, partial [Halobacteriaceae archaeon]